MSRTWVIPVLALLFISPVVAQDQPCAEQFDELEQEAEAAMEQANSSEERQEIEERFNQRFQELEQECAERNDTREEPETVQEEPPSDRYAGEPSRPRAEVEKMPAEKCRKQASSIKQEFANAITDTGIMQMQGPIEQFMRSRGRLVAQCSIFGGEPGEGRVAPPPEARPPERPPERPPVDRPERREREERGEPEEAELSYELPERTPERCREKVEQLKEEYMSKIAENPDNSSELRQEFYTKVEKRLEGCEGRPRLVNVSEAPPMMSESCKQQMRELNQEITANTDAQVGDPVPKEYLDRYKKQIKSCMQGAVAGEVKERIRSKIGEAAGNLFGGGETSQSEKSLRQKLAAKEQKIAELEAKVDSLQQRLDEQDAAQQPAGPAPDTQDRADRPQDDTAEEPRTGAEPQEPSEPDEPADSGDTSAGPQPGTGGQPSDQAGGAAEAQPGQQSAEPAEPQNDTGTTGQEQGGQGIVDTITSIFG